MPIAGNRLPIIEVSVRVNSNGDIDSLSNIFTLYLHIRPVSVELVPLATCISLKWALTIGRKGARSLHFAAMDAC